MDKNYDVIIPMKNGWPFIEQAIDSILAQTLKPNQIFLVNDHSTDEALELVKSRYPSVCILHSQFFGQAHALNLGVSKSRSNFVSFLDADDIWSVGKQEKQINILLKSHDLDYVSSGIRNFLHGGQQEMHVKEFKDARLLGACTFRRNVFSRFGGFDTSEYKEVFLYEFFYRIRNLRQFSTGTVELYRRIHDRNMWISEREELTKSLFQFLRNRIRT